MIKKTTIDQIFETARIEEVVGDFVAMKQRGVNRIGLCPFHNEKTPSFTVSPVKGIYKCFGCGQGGNAINFVMEHEKYSYPEALRYVAKKYNIDIEEDQLTDEEVQQQSERESQFLVLNYAKEYYMKTLLETEEGKAIGLSYFKERGVSDEMIEKFELGYSLDTWDAFTKSALEKGYKLDYLEKAGLTITNKKKSFDRFKGRMIFPIHNYSGKVLGFGGRILKNEAKAAKYINSPETDIYEKRKVLYGIYFSKKAIILEDNCYIVEGYTDVISLHQVGVENVVSSSGTSLTVDQIRLVKRITKNVTILFDGDAAGIKASLKGVDLILEEDMNVKIVLFPDGQDPDSYARSVDVDEFKQFITENARDFISFKAGLLMDEAENDPVKKTALVREIVQSIAVIPDAISRSVYIQECGNLLSISEQILINELNKLRKRKANAQRNADAGYDDVAPLDYIKGHPSEIGGARQEPIEGNAEPQERDVIRYLLSYGLEKISFPEEKTEEDEENNDTKGEQKVEEVEIEVARFIVEEIANDGLTFDHPVYNNIFSEYEKRVLKNKTPAQDFFLQHDDPKVAGLAVDLIFSPHELSDNWEERHHILVSSEEQTLKKSVERTVYSFKMAKVKQMLLEKREAIKDLEDGKTRDELLKEHYNLEEAKKLISRYLGRVLSPN